MNKTMRNMAVALVALSTVGGAAALAQQSPPPPPAPPAQQALPSPTTKGLMLSDVVKRLEDGGYTIIRQIERTRGHWVARALDQAGELRALVIDPVSGAIAEAPPRPPRTMMRHNDRRPQQDRRGGPGPQMPPRRT